LLIVISISAEAKEGPTSSSSFLTMYRIVKHPKGLSEEWSKKGIKKAEIICKGRCDSGFVWKALSPRIYQRAQTTFKV
jgi:hypothetical protein